MKFHDVEQNSEAWLELRLGKVTASRFGAMMAFDSDPVDDYIKLNFGPKDHVDKSIFNFLNGKRLGSNQQKTVDFIKSHVKHDFDDTEKCIHDSILSHSKALNLPKNDFGDQAKGYALQLALEIINNRSSDYGFSNAEMERGHMQEPVARMLYEDEYFVTVENGGFFDCGEYGTSPDGLVGEDGGIEIKSVIPTTHFANLQRGGIDPAYKWQVIGHLDCTGRNWFDFVSFCSDFPPEKRLLVYRTNRIDVVNEIQSLRERRSQFLGLVQDTIKFIKGNFT